MSLEMSSNQFDIDRSQSPSSLSTEPVKLIVTADADSVQVRGAAIYFIRVAAGEVDSLNFHELISWGELAFPALDSMNDVLGMIIPSLSQRIVPPADSEFEERFVPL